LPPGDKVKYRDEFGLEQLVLHHHLTPDQIELMDGLSRAQRELLKNSHHITLTHKGMLVPGNTGKDSRWLDIGMYFRVLKDSELGSGLAWPDMASVFQAAAQWESMEVGDSLLATVGRIVYEQHAKGHEIKSGPHAGANWHT
jgi:hypothetical protein